MNKRRHSTPVLQHQDTALANIVRLDLIQKECEYKFNEWTFGDRAFRFISVDDARISPKTANKVMFSISRYGDYEQVLKLNTRVCAKIAVEVVESYLSITASNTYVDCIE
jgi:hypothetical protein